MLAWHVLIYSFSCSDDDDDDDDEDDTEALMAELERIKKERAEEQLRQVNLISCRDFLHWYSVFLDVL